MLGAARLAQVPRSTAGPVGQAFWIEQGSQSWVVPVGVTSVCVVAIGGGAQNASLYDPETDSFYNSFGGGGALVYVNNLPVTPGESLTVDTLALAGNGGAARLFRGTTQLILANGGVNGESEAMQLVNYWGSPGGAGSVHASVTGAVIRTGGHGYDLGLRAGAAKYGGGAQGETGTSLNGSGDTTNRLCGRQFISTEASIARSGLRIIWGAGRAFPNTNTGDL
jgi:hypothetical protein